MTEELKRRLEFKDSAIQLAAAGKLYSLVINKQQTDADIDIITTTTPNIPELEVLWDNCGSSSPVISLVCCDALVSLVKHGHAEFTYILTGFLNLVPSVKNVGGITNAISHLLLLQLRSDVEIKKEQSIGYSCQYKLRSPPHPFISVLSGRPDTWPFLLQQVSNILQNQVYGLAMLKPFLKYVILDPNQSTQYSSLRSALYDVLIQEARSRKQEENGAPSDDVKIFLLDCLLCIQTDNPQHLCEAVLQLQALSGVIGSKETTLLAFVCHALTLCKKLLDFGLEMTSVLKVISTVIPDNESVQLDLVFNLWSNLLIQCPACEMNALLELGRKLFIQNQETEKPNRLSSTTKRLMVLPLLHYISTPIGPAVTMETSHRGHNQILAGDVFLSTVNQDFKGSSLEYSTDVQVLPLKSVDPQFNYISFSTKLVKLFHDNSDVACDWLLSIQSNLSSCGHLPDMITTIVAALFLSEEMRIASLALDVLVGIASQDTSQAPRLLPLLLYRLSQVCQKDSPELILPILNAIPKTVTHKICVGPALRTLQGLGESDSISPLALRLITALWEKQDRVFPHLQKLLSDPHDASDSEPCEILLAKAASIKDVCVHRPNQHGADLLPSISKILKDCSRDSEATIAALALEALMALCEAEVVDIRTTWEVLSPKLSKDNRPLVLQSLCKLFSLVPSLAVETEEYEDFRCDIVESLWNYSKSNDIRVCIAAFQALANFGEDEFSLDDLPEEVTAEVRAKLAAAKAQEEEKKELEAQGGDVEEGKEEEEEEEEIDVPGTCYVKLLQFVPEDAYPGLQKLLVSLVAQELRTMPRGIHKTAMQSQHKIASQDKVLTTIPKVLLNKYEKNRQPGLKAALAGGLLFCYEPKLEIGRDGRMARRHLVSQGRAYQQMMVTLVNEVTCQTTEWYRLLQNPHGWTSYMERTFKALLEGREAELEMQQSHGHNTDKPEEFQNKLASVWLWVRDKLTDQLKSAAKGEPSAQGNSLLALVGLALVSTHHALSLGQTADDNQQKASEHIGHNRWLMIVIETLFSIVDGRYKAKGKVFNWCHQRTNRGMSTASTLAQSCAILGLAQLTPLIITLDSSIIYQMIDVITRGLPGQATAAESSVIQLHHGIGLGWVLKSLYEERFTDVSGNEGSMAMLRALDILEESALKSPTGEATHGAMLGLSLALSTLANEGAAHVRAHLKSIHSKLTARLEEEKELGAYLQAICICVASVTSSGFHSNTINPSDAFNAAIKLQTVCQEHSQVPGLAISTGLLFHNLVQGGHPNIPPLMSNLYSTWISTLEAKGSSQQKVAALSGLTTLVMGAGALYQTAGETNISTELQSNTGAVLKLLTQGLQDGKDPGVQTASPGLLGITYMASSSVSQSKTGIPSSYSYLPDTSILKACMELLIESGKVGPERISHATLFVVLSAMVGETKSLPSLPPVNWAAVLAPLLRLPYGEEVELLCIELAMKQCLSQPSAAMFVNSWISQPLFNGLHERSKESIYSSLPTLIRAVPSNKLKDFIESSLIEPFTIPGVYTELCQAVLTGLLASLKISDLPQSVPMMLYGAVEAIYGYMPKQLQICHIPLMTLLSNCLCYLPGEHIDRIASPSVQDNLVKATFVRSYLVSEGKQGLVWLNPCIDVIMNLATESDTPTLLWILVAGFRCSSNSSSTHMGAMNKMQWFMELLGHVKSVAYGNIPLASAQTIAKAVDLTLHVLCGAVTMWSTPDTALLLGVEPQCFTSSRNGSGLQNKILIGQRDLEKMAVTNLLPLLPYSLSQLLQQQPWQQITAKVLDWLLVMLEAPPGALTEEHTTYIEASVLALRHTSEFKKPAYWTRAFSR
ncbi:focadhesin-like [Amphiura filiformis]|uniref:focadhesin-like n=1 Tax=Amphiura filiformis TaxID=82378 RepID=UPI003B2164FA